LKLNLKTDPVGTVIGVGLPALGLGGIVAALAITNAKLDVPIVGSVSGRKLPHRFCQPGWRGRPVR